MKLNKTVTRPMIQVKPDLEVPVKRVTWTLTAGQVTFAASWQAKPAIPEAFR